MLKAFLSFTGTAKEFWQFLDELKQKHEEYNNLFAVRDSVRLSALDSGEAEQG